MLYGQGAKVMQYVFDIFIVGFIVVLSGMALFGIIKKPATNGSMPKGRGLRLAFKRRSSFRKGQPNNRP